MGDEPVVVEPKARPGLAPNVHGALWMLGSALAFTAMATLIKFLGEDYPAPLQTFYRQLAGFLIVLMNLVVELTYGWIDPRVRLGQAARA